jgi:hypothetical protein
MNTELELSHRADFAAMCSCVTTKTLGYPCGHHLRRCEAAGEPVSLSSIHRHWRLDPVQADTLPSPERVILAPQPLRRRRSVASRNTSHKSLQEQVLVTAEEEQPGHISTILAPASAEVEMESAGEAPIAVSAPSSRRRPRAPLRRMPNTGEYPYLV